MGYLLAWCSLFPIFLLVSFLTLVTIRRDLFTVRRRRERGRDKGCRDLERDSYISFICLIKIIIIIINLVLILQVFFFIGLILNEGLNLLLKYTIREPRPISGWRKLTLSLNFFPLYRYSKRSP